jgi:two-component system CheB/CheR fusion protein
MLDVSALQSGKYTVRPSRIRLDEVVAQAVEMSRLLAEDWTIEYTPPREPIWVSGDADRLQQVMLNLINNAYAHAASTPRITVRLHPDTRMAELQVQDYGPGIPQSDLQHIFSRFYQSQDAKRGLGLGLYIAHEIVAAHGGTLTVTSTAGKGTAFTVRLPTAPEEEGGKGRSRR